MGKSKGPRTFKCPNCGARGTTTVGAFTPSGDMMVPTDAQIQAEDTLYGLFCIRCGHRGGR